MVCIIIRLIYETCYTDYSQAESLTEEQIAQLLAEYGELNNEDLLEDEDVEGVL